MIPKISLLVFDLDGFSIAFKPKDDKVREAAIVSVESFYEIPN